MQHITSSNHISQAYSKYLTNLHQAHLQACSKQYYRHASNTCHKLAETNHTSI